MIWLSKNSYPYFVRKSLDKFSSGFFLESGIGYVPMGMAQGESDRKIAEMLFKDVVPMAQEKQNIARASYTNGNTKYYNCC